MKYKNKPIIYNGVWYQSTKEGLYAQQLDTLKYATNPADKVVSWERQIRFRLELKGIKLCDYVLDFRVLKGDGTIEHIDVKGYTKGTAYEHFKLKKKLMKVCHDIDVKEV